MLAILCPGQGSQSPGFLNPWLDLPGVREHLAALSESAGVDLVRHGTVSDEETIRDTAVAQPLIVAAGLVAVRVLLGTTPLTSATVVAGHSVGELTASAVAGALTEQDAVALVRTRAQSMAAAAAAIGVRSGKSEPLQSVSDIGGLPAQNSAHPGRRGGGSRRH